MASVYGSELILDLHGCQALPCDRAALTRYLEGLCDQIGMQREDLHFWDYSGCPDEYEKAPPHLKGTSAVQFIRTSNVTIHTLDDLGRVYVNIFSCKAFDDIAAERFTSEFFQGTVVNRALVERA